MRKDPGAVEWEDPHDPEASVAGEAEPSVGQERLVARRMRGASWRRRTTSPSACPADEAAVADGAEQCATDGEVGDLDLGLQRVERAQAPIDLVDDASGNAVDMTRPVTRSPRPRAGSTANAHSSAWLVRSATNDASSVPKGGDTGGRGSRPSG